MALSKYNFKKDQQMAFLLQHQHPYQLGKHFLKSNFKFKQFLLIWLDFPEKSFNFVIHSQKHKNNA